VITLVIGILIIVVVGAILFWVIDKFCPDRRLGYLLKLLQHVPTGVNRDSQGAPQERV
jgi:hypothetical protein